MIGDPPNAEPILIIPTHGAIRHMGQPDHKRIVAVIGGEKASAQFLQTAESVGRLVAQAGAILACGGLGGVMEAACRGAKSAGGLTIGILPGADAADANPYVDIAIPTAMSTARNVILVRTADAVIAIDGAYGTLSEMAHALDQGKRVVSLGAWDLARIGADTTRLVTAETAEDAVRLALAPFKPPSANR